MTPLRSHLLVGAAAAILAGAAAWALKPTPAPGYSAVTVPDAAILARRPTAQPTLGQRVTTHEVRPQQVATSAGRPDSARVNRFCSAAAQAANAAPAIAVQTSALDSAGASPQRGNNVATAPTPQLPPFAGKYDGRTLQLDATRSDGSLWQGTYRAHTPLEWIAGDTGVTVRERRALLRALMKLPKCGKGAAIGAALGGLLGALAKEPLGGVIGGGAVGCAGGAL
jgi:hypothetical protein